MDRRRGELQHRSRLKEADVLEIRRRFAADPKRGSLASIHRDFPQVSKVTIFNVVHGRTWKHLPCDAA